MQPAPNKAPVSSLRPMLRYLRPYRRQIALAGVALFLTSSAVLGLGGGLRYLVDEGLSKNDTELLNRAFWLLIGVTLLLAGATYARFSLVSWLGEKVVADIRNDVYRRLISMHIGFFETTKTGELLSRLTADTTLLQTVISSSISIAVRNGLLLVGGFSLLLFTSAQLTLYVLLMVPVVVAPIIILGRKVRGLGREAQGKVADISAYAEESLFAIRAVQALALEPHEQKQFAQRVEEAFSAAMQRIRTRAFLMSLVIALVFGAIATVLWMGGHDVVSGRISSGQLSAFVFYSVVVAGSVGAISEVWADIQRAAGAAERLSQLLDMQPEIRSPESAKPMPPEASVRFENVTFFYPSRPERAAVLEFSLDVAAGQKIALVGHSGGGKTTLFQMLLRFYDPSSGRITIGGVDIRDMALADLRGAIGIVPQDPVIFSASARENIRLGNPGASDEEVMEAARAASALEFIEKMPQGMDTYLGEKGVRLSGGQKQRIAIARAIIRNPSILLLDEATSALDSENERLIQQALQKIMQGRTTFVIAHRLSTVTKADRIILMREGHIEAMGSHSELLVKSPEYTRLAQLQFQAA